MKRIMLGLLVLGVVFLSLASTSSVSAQSGDTCTPGNGESCGLGGMRGNKGGIRNGVLHDEMVTIFAQELGLTEEEINDRLAEGETMSQIALSTGLTQDQFTSLMTEVRSQAIDLAVQNGTLTQEQAQLMNQARNLRGMMRGMGNRNSANYCLRNNTQD